jgi:hypothetical protein
MRLTSKTVLIVAALTVTGVMALPAGAAPATYTTSPQSAPDPHPNHETQLWRVRVSNDGSFDRIVLDERFSPAGYRVRYVHRVIADGSGHTVHVKGHYFLSLSMPNTSTSGAAGTPTDVHQKYTPNLPEIVQIKKTGEFEGVVSFGIGLRHRNGFHVFRLKSPARLVIDVLH